MTPSLRDRKDPECTTHTIIYGLVKAVAEALKEQSTPLQCTLPNTGDGPPCSWLATCASLVCSGDGVDTATVARASFYPAACSKPTDIDTKVTQEHTLQNPLSGTFTKTSELAKHHNVRAIDCVVRKRTKLALIQQVLHRAYCYCLVSYPACTMSYPALLCVTFKCAHALCPYTTLTQH